MSYAYAQNVPITMAIYEQIRAALGPVIPAGLIVHLVMQQEEGLRYIDVWESEQHYLRFVNERLHPAVGPVFARAGLLMSDEPPLLPLDVREVWTP